MTPQTIEEFIQLCNEKNVPYEKMRFMLGQDCREPKCFGIYKDPDTGEFVVYKNKADGTRYERYRGIDEAYAVSIIYQKMDDEIVKRRMEKPADRALPENSFEKRRKTERKTVIIATAAAAAIVAVGVGIALHAQKTGYYHSPDDGIYYYLDDDWYYWNDDVWDPYYGDTEGYVYDGDTWNSDEYVEDFEDTTYYEQAQETDTDADSDWSSDDFDDWDSSDTDWDSDW